MLGNCVIIGGIVLSILTDCPGQHLQRPGVIVGEIRFQNRRRATAVVAAQERPIPPTYRDCT
jgi:hypothetical protein